MERSHGILECSSEAAFQEVTPSLAAGTNKTFEVSIIQSFGSIQPSPEELIARIAVNYRPSSTTKSGSMDGIHVDVPLSLQDASRGGSAHVMLPIQVHCNPCSGTGRLGQYKCHFCEGCGFRSEEKPVVVPYPAGVPDSYMVTMPLKHFGIANLYLTVRFCVGE